MFKIGLSGVLLLGLMWLSASSYASEINSEFSLEPSLPELQATLEGTGVVVSHGTQGIILSIPADSHFYLGTPNARQASVALIGRLSELLNRYDSLQAEVAGFTDSRGNDKFNVEISQKQAKYVMQQLTLQGVAPERVRSVGYGEAHPVADNAHADGRQMNRRLELTLSSRLPVLMVTNSP